LIDNWRDYKSWISDATMAGVQFYYRGQRKLDWKLQTSFHRVASKSNITLIDYLDKIIPEVQYHSCAALNEIIDVSNEQQFGTFLAKLQHHGFPTPLLDWTLSPYIAAYFAFREIDPHNPDTDKVSIYVFDINEWHETFQQHINLRQSPLFVGGFRPFAKDNPRMARQQAVTTATNIPDLGEYLNDKGKDVNKTFLYHADSTLKCNQFM